MPKMYYSYVFLSIKISRPTVAAAQLSGFVPYGLEFPRIFAFLPRKTKNDAVYKQVSKIYIRLP